MYCSNCGSMLPRGCFHCPGCGMEIRNDTPIPEDVIFEEDAEVPEELPEEKPTLAYNPEIKEPLPEHKPGRLERKPLPSPEEQPEVVQTEPEKKQYNSRAPRSPGFFAVFFAVILCIFLTVFCLAAAIQGTVHSTLLENGLTVSGAAAFITGIAEPSELEALLPFGLHLLDFFGSGAMLVLLCVPVVLCTVGIFSLLRSFRRGMRFTGVALFIVFAVSLLLDGFLFFYRLFSKTRPWHELIPPFCLKLLIICAIFLLLGILCSLIGSIRRRKKAPSSDITSP